MPVDSDIRVRIDSEEKADFKKLAKERGFNSLSAFVLYLLRNEKKKGL